jgi:hypothetical protein
MVRLEELGGVICKSAFANHPSHLHEFCKSPLPTLMSSPLDQDHVVYVEVSIVYTERWFPLHMFHF